MSFKSEGKNKEISRKIKVEIMFSRPTLKDVLRKNSSGSGKIF